MSYGTTQGGLQPLAKINLTALVGVLMVLLISMLASSPRSGGFDLIEFVYSGCNLGSPVRPTVRPEIVVLRLETAPNAVVYRWNGEAMDLGGATARLRSHHWHDPQPEIQLSAAGTVPFQSVTEILSITRNLGFVHV